MAVTYKSAGVDIFKADRFIDSIKALAKNKSIGGFSGLFKLNLKEYRQPYLAASCDGVGTKLKVALWLNEHKTIGIDLVAMNVNDLITCGAKPLLFLDYVSSTSLRVSYLKQIVKGIVLGSRESNCVLLGGETAQMPGLYRKDDYDLAGFCLGIVDKKNIIDGSKIKEKDVVIGLASNGLHSNGYSLVRKLFPKKFVKDHRRLFYRPTKIYVKPILKLKEKLKIRGIAHITGGGFYDNILRILPKRISVEINKNSWPLHEVFKLIQKKGKISQKQMHHTFNMGIGMVVIVDRKDVRKTQKILSNYKIKSYAIGHCLKSKKAQVIIK